MNKDLHILINNEEVVCDKNITINEEMLSTSSTILKNCYPKSWETTKDYVSNFYFPKDYSKCKIFNEIYHPEIPGSTISGSNLSINYDNTLNYEIQELKGNTTQNGTPTPSSPVPINNVTGLQKVNVCGKNLLDISDITTTRYITNNGDGSITLNGFGEGISFPLSKSFVLKANTPYTLSLTNTNTSYNGATFILRNGNTNIFLISYSESEKHYTPTEDVVIDTLRIYGAGLTFDNYTFSVQLEKGSTATTYEPYKGNTYEVNLGKNLFDKDNANIKIEYIDANGNWEIDRNDRKTILINCKENTIYTISKIASSFFRVGSFETIPVNLTPAINYVIGTNTTTNITINTGNNAQYLAITYYSTSDTLTEQQILNSIQIEVGSQATTYSEYFTPIELCKIGNYQDRIYKENGTWYIEKNIGKVVLDGTENWSSVDSSTRFTTSQSSIPNIANALINTSGSSSNLTPALSNYFTVSIQKNITKTSNNFGFSKWGNSVWLYFSAFKDTVADFKNWLSNNKPEIYYVLATPTITEITNTDLINQLESIELLKGINNISVISPNEFGLLQIHYNYKEAYTTEDLIFCGLVKNTGNISLNPREPHYVDLQLLDFKDLLSTGETLNYVITGKTIVEAIEQVVASISDYGFIVGNINILRPDDIINAYSTLNKTAYDVFQYISDITQSKWFTRVIDENTIAIDFYDPTLMPQATTIEYTKEYFENNDIEDMTFNYSTNDYRNKQIMTSDEVYANITQTETLVSNGYQDSYMAQNKIGIITSITVNGVSKTFATKSEVELGASADFEYQPGEMTFTSNTTYNAGSIIIITYYPIVRGREIVLNNEETSRIQSQINRKGTISRYENRNDTTSSQELIKIGQSYIKYKGNAEITLKIITSKNLFNVGQIVEFNAPLEELSTEYMVKSKTIEIITTIDQIFYTYELSSNFNSENAINYFDNQRAKSQGNIGEGETIARAIDIESTALIKFYDTTINEVEVSNPTSLDFALDGVLI